MIVAMGLSLNVAAIILGCILSMLLSVFNALGPISITTPPTVALTEFFHADTVARVHPLPVSWYLISSLWVYWCSSMQIMSILCSTVLRFETLWEKTEKGTRNDEYENFVDAHLDEASKCIPTKPRTKYRVPWETLAVREKLALVKTVSKAIGRTQQTQMPVN